MQLHTRIIIGMALGIGLGALLGPQSAFLPKNRLTTSKGSGVNFVTAPGGESVQLIEFKGHGEAIPTVFHIDDRKTVAGQEWWSLWWRLESRHLVQIQSLPESERTAMGAQNLEVGTVRRAWVRAHEPGLPPATAGLGTALERFAYLIGEVFLRLLKMVIVPLVFASLVVGVASLGDVRRLGRVGGRTLAYFLVTTALAVTIGLVLANVIRPGAWIEPAQRQALAALYETDASARVSKAGAAADWVENILSMVPQNPMAEATQGNMLALIVFAILFGLALTAIDATKAKPVVAFFDGLNDVMTMIIQMAMKIAPYGVAALLFQVVGRAGFNVLSALALYMATVLLGLLTHLIVVYGGILRFLARLPFWPFMKRCRQVHMVAFSTSSSNATLPVTLATVQREFGISNPIASFVIPLGATVNMDGTALYQGVATVFIAQSFGLDLSLSDQLTVVVAATLASVGAAGVPGAGVATLILVLASVGLPAAGIALILGVDRLLDMFRTVVNVTGDMVVCATMARFEGERPTLVAKESSP